MSERERYDEWFMGALDVANDSYADAWRAWQAAAYVLPDDNEPVTAEWWDRYGSRLSICFCADGALVFLAGTLLRAVHTRRDVRQLCRALNIELKESTK